MTETIRGEQTLVNKTIPAKANVNFNCIQKFTYLFHRNMKLGQYCHLLAKLPNQSLILKLSFCLLYPAVVYVFSLYKNIFLLLLSDLLLKIVVLLSVIS